MTNVDRLDDLRDAFPHCRLVVFGDMSTGTVLCASAADRVPQEQLDSLCATAAELLRGSAADRIAAALGHGDHRQLRHAITIEPAEVGIFLRSDLHPDDTLCCVCDGLADVDRFLVAARTSLDRLSAGQ